jgi:hypothetical protein
MKRAPRKARFLSGRGMFNSDPFLRPFIGHSHLSVVKMWSHVLGADVFGGTNLRPRQ